jgi:hypothetical protein
VLSSKLSDFMTFEVAHRDNGSFPRVQRQDLKDYLVQRVHRTNKKFPGWEKHASSSAACSYTPPVSDHVDDDDDEWNMKQHSRGIICVTKSVPVRVLWCANERDVPGGRSKQKGCSVVHTHHSYAV